MVIGQLNFSLVLFFGLFFSSREREREREREKRRRRQDFIRAMDGISDVRSF